MPHRQRSLSLLLMISCLLISACSIGPQTETRYVIVSPGMPVVLLENVTVKARLLTDENGKVVEQDIGGWVAMPRQHWDALKRALESNQKTIETPSLGTKP